jgi:hypothetical protein
VPRANASLRARLPTSAATRLPHLLLSGLSLRPYHNPCTVLREAFSSVIIRTSAPQQVTITGPTRCIERAFPFGHNGTDTSHQACFHLGHNGANVPRRAGFSFGHNRTDASHQVCFHLGHNGPIVPRRAGFSFGHNGTGASHHVCFHLGHNGASVPRRVGFSLRSR